MASVLRSWLRQHGLDHFLVHLSRTHEVYRTKGCAFAALNGKVRGTIFERAARERDRLLHPSCRVVDVQDIHNLPGNPPFDWLRVDRDGIQTRVEHKSAKLSWSATGNLWYACFMGIKADQHDELQLTLFTPRAIFCFTHKEALWPILGKKSSARGRVIKLLGPSGADMDTAVSTILTKVAVFSSTSSYPLDDPLLELAAASAISRTHEIYAARGCPLSSLDNTVRGTLLEMIARERDIARYPECFVVEPDRCFGVDGRLLHVSHRRYDWKRVHKYNKHYVRVEHKSAQVKWDSRNVLWRVQWGCIKTECYDELQLTMYSPKGLRTFAHDGATGLSGRGSNRCINIQGPRGESDIDLSVTVILEKAIAAFGSPIMELL